MKTKILIALGLGMLLSACTTNNYYSCDHHPMPPRPVRDGDVPHRHVPPAPPADAQ